MYKVPQQDQVTDYVLRDDDFCLDLQADTGALVEVPEAVQAAIEEFRCHRATIRPGS